jgi:hypothetical protein
MPRDTGWNFSAGEKHSALPPKGGWCLTVRALFWVPRAPGLAWAISHRHWLLVIWRPEALSSFSPTGRRATKSRLEREAEHQLAAFECGTQGIGLHRLPPMPDSHRLMSAVAGT